MRPEHHPVVDQRGQRRGQLNRGVGVVALADADRNGLAAVPLLLARLLESSPLPGWRGQHPGRLAGNVHTGLRTEAERRHEIGDGLDPEVIGQHVVVGIARIDNGFVQIDHAVATDLVIHEAVASEDEIPRVGDRLPRAALAQLQPGQPHEGLEGGARRVGGINGAIEQRVVGRVVQCLPVGHRNAIHEQIGVEARGGHQRQHTTGLGVHGHERPPPAFKGLAGNPLQSHIHRENQAVARLRGLAVKHTHRTTADIDLDLLGTRSAVQQ